MKFIGLLIYSTVLSSAFCAESAFEREGKQLKEQRDKALAASNQQINARYKEALQLLLRRATDGNDLELALKLKKELENLSLFDSDWGNPADAGYLTFHADGSASSSWGLKGTWKYEGDYKLTIKFDKSELWTVDPAFQWATRTTDGMKWKRGK